ncbi:transcription termination/antitermination NusG family protein [Gemmiger formicilis]|jgi:transcription antitermination factor NusG|uniref:transcription termination/antitermination NusG family protein n=1 Tax=Gemmiger formicilis TaxID=745368 RepID=UPI003521F420
MSMYALQVMTGMEAEITQKLRGKGVDARCPQERRMIRRGGKWQEQLYTLFPSYIFVSTPDVYRVYYAVRDEDGVLHWLGATKGTPEALSAREEANILWLAGDGPLPPSEAEVQADGTLDFTSGPLAHLRDLLEKVNRHDRRVTVRVPVGGEDKTITLSYRLNGRQETASNAAAGTPRSVNTADIF